MIRNTQRNNPDAQCSLNEELAPIDEDLQYDFNFQTANVLPQEIVLYRVSISCHLYIYEVIIFSEF